VTIIKGGAARILQLSEDDIAEGFFHQPNATLVARRAQVAASSLRRECPKL
jgi:hypothetical protein